MECRLKHRFLQVSTIIAAIGLAWGLFSQINDPLFGRFDFIQYWSATRSLFEGVNPYDQRAIWILEKVTLPELPYRIVMWNPPTVFAITFPLGLLDFQVAAKIWFVLSISLISLAIVLSINSPSFVAGEGQPGLEKPAFILVVLFISTFYPFALSLSYGQISPILLLATAVILFSIHRAKDFKYYSLSVGLALAFTSIKPHLFYLVYLWFLARAVRSKDFAILILAVVGAIVLLLPGLYLNCDLISLYFEATHSPPIHFMTPTIGSWLQDITRENNLWIRLLPSLIAAVFTAMFLFRRSIRASDLNWLLPLSLLTSPYGWVYDQLVLLPVALGLLVRTQERSVRSILIVANLLLAITPPEWGQQCSVWYPALIAILAWKKSPDSSYS